MIKNGTQFKKGLAKKKWWFLVLIIVGVGVYFVSRPGVVQVVEKIEGKGLEYKVVSESPESQWIIIETTYIPSESELKATAYKAWQKNKEKENIFLYLPNMNTGSAAYGIGRFIPGRGLKVEGLEIKPVSLKGTKWEQNP